MKTPTHYITLKLQNIDVAGYGLTSQMAMDFVHIARCNGLHIAVSFPKYFEGKKGDGTNGLARGKKLEPSLGETWVLHGAQEDLEKLGFLLNGTMHSRFFTLGRRVRPANNPSTYYAYRRVRHPDNIRMPPYVLVKSGSTKQGFSLIISQIEVSEPDSNIEMTDDTVSTFGLCKGDLALPSIVLQ